MEVSRYQTENQGGKMAEIRFAGYGGQGIIRSGIIVGRAASIYDSKFSTMSQSFGPEARGGACSSQLLVSGSKVLYPYITSASVLVAMSQAGYDKFEPELAENGTLLYDEDLVKPKPPREEITPFAIPATRFAEQLGKKNRCECRNARVFYCDYQGRDL